MCIFSSHYYNHVEIVSGMLFEFLCLLSKLLLSLLSANLSQTAKIADTLLQAPPADSSV